MMFKGKKGVMDDMFDFLSIVISLFFLLLFLNIYLGGTIETSKQLTINKVGSFNAEENLLTYLKRPVEVGTMSDLIISWYYDPTRYEGKLKLESEKILDNLPKPHPLSGWNVRIFFEDEEKIDIITYNIVGDYERRNKFALLSLREPGKSLKIELYLECEDVGCI